MSTHKHIDRICLVVAVLSILLSICFINGQRMGIQAVSPLTGYSSRLFDTSRVHTIDIVMDDWDTFLQTCRNEEYSACTVVIDGEAFKNVGIRGKGNTSLSQVASMDSDRYSFKVEFDQYDSTRSYYGLDKLSLNNLIQDNTMMKDYLTYQLMGQLGAPAPYCSFVYLTVNGEDWGLYLAVEAIEDSFLRRNYGSSYGELYKPESTGGGGGGMSSPATKLQYVDDDPDSYSAIFSSAKTDLTDADKARLIRSLKQLSAGKNISDVVAVDDVIRYFVVHNFVCNGDSYTGSMIHNYYLYEQDGKLSMLPWDYNLAFGAFHSSGDAAGTVNSPIDTPVSGTTGEDRPMISWIFADEEYTRLYHKYFTQFLAGTDFAALVDDTAALIAPYVERDPTKFCTYEQFQTAAQTLKQFCLLREQSVQGQLDGTIPSTTQGQKNDPSTLIDTSGLDLQAMGSMGGGRGGMGGNREGPDADPQPQQGQFMPQMENRPQPNNTPQTDGLPQTDGGTFPANNLPLTAPTRPNDGPFGAQPGGSRGGFGPGQNGQFPGQVGQEGQPDTTQLILVLTCVICLLVGLVFAFFFRPRR